MSTTIISRRRFGAVSAAAALTIALSACGGPSPETSTGANASGGGVLTIGAQLDNNSFDTAALEIGNRTQFWQPVYDTLIQLDPEAKPTPGLAEGWSYNDDNTVLTLKLREGVTFSDGEALTAEAVKANIEHLKNGTGQNSFMAKPVAEVAVLSPTEVELRLNEPTPSMLSYLGTVAGAMASPKALADGDLANNPVGAGPYIYDAATTVKGTSYTYNKNPNYWNKEQYQYDKVVVMTMNDITPRLNALKAGQINGAFITPNVAAEAEASGLKVHKLPVNWAGLLIGDRDGKIVPALADERVRQALNYAIDREGLLKNVQLGYGQVTNQVSNKNSDAYDPSLEGTYTYDPEKAKKLLAEAGYADGFSMTMPSSAAAPAIYPILQQQLADVGITVNYESVPPDQTIAAFLSGKYPVFYTPLGSATAWQDLQTWVTPTAPWNMFKNQDPELDELIETAQAATGDEQKTAFRAVGKWLVEKAWFAPFYTPDNLFATTSDTTTTMQAQNSVPFLHSFAPAGK